MVVDVSAQCRLKGTFKVLSQWRVLINNGLHNVDWAILSICCSSTPNRESPRKSVLQTHPLTIGCTSYKRSDRGIC